MVNSATDCAFAPSARSTAMPRAVAASMSMTSVPAAAREMTRSDGQDAIAAPEIGTKRDSTPS